MIETPKSNQRPALVLTDEVEPETVALLAGGLDEQIVHELGGNDNRPLAVLVKDPETARVIGGLTGRTSMGVLFVDLFHLPVTLRGSGIGSEVLRLAEEESRRRGCEFGVLYTITFQAPGFYKKQGWEVFGEIPCNRPGTSRFFMKKDLR